MGSEVIIIIKFIIIIGHQTSLTLHAAVILLVVELSELSAVVVPAEQALATLAVLAAVPLPLPTRGGRGAAPVVLAWNEEIFREIELRDVSPF